jgi:hypothetical protein
MNRLNIEPVQVCVAFFRTTVATGSCNTENIEPSVREQANKLEPHSTQQLFSIDEEIYVVLVMNIKHRQGNFEVFSISRCWEALLRLTVLGTRSQRQEEASIEHALRPRPRYET